jgi:hypothetical protein
MCILNIKHSALTASNVMETFAGFASVSHSSGQRPGKDSVSIGICKIYGHAEFPLSDAKVRHQGHNANIAAGRNDNLRATRAPGATLPTEGDYQKSLHTELPKLWCLAT